MRAPFFLASEGMLRRMARLNTTAQRPPVTAFLRTEDVPTGTTALGAPGFAREPKTELYLLGQSMFAGEQTFDEAAAPRDTRFITLVRTLAVSDPGWTGGFLGSLRVDSKIRTAAILGAAEFVAVRKELGIAEDSHTRREPGLGRRVIASVLYRLDDITDLLAYWTAHYGKNIPKELRKGIADAARRILNERSLLKWDSPGRPWRIGDMLALIHPRPRDERQSATWKYALNRRHGHPEDLPAGVPLLRYRRELMALPAHGENGNMRREWLLRASANGDVADHLRSAGMTWESVAGWIQGPMDTVAWEAIAPAMNYLALLRNLRNFDQARISNAVAEQISAHLASVVDVTASGVLPFQILAAYRAVSSSLRWSWPLEQGLNHSLHNIPALAGRSLILVDRSPSMWQRTLSGHSTMCYADAAAVFGAALALRCEHADLVEFGESNGRVEFSPTSSVLALVKQFNRRQDGTNIPRAVQDHLRRGVHHRVVIITDEQTREGYLPYLAQSSAWGRWERRYVGTDSLIPADVPMYMWNIGGYEYGAVPAGGANRHLLGGLNDAGFAMITRLEAGLSARWPFPSLL